VAHPEVGTPETAGSRNLGALEKSFRPDQMLADGFNPTMAVTKSHWVPDWVTAQANAPEGPAIIGLLGD